MGGEKRRVQQQDHLQAGSPPRGRGKAAFDDNGYVNIGITPAWAGKRYLYTMSAPSARDHPRVGGEKPIDAVKVLRKEGSPPRGRGKAIVKQMAAALERITPAWAGKRRRRG